MLYLGNKKLTIGYRVLGGNVTLQTKTVVPKTTEQVITADGTYTGLASVVVSAIPSEYIIPTGTKTIVTNGDNINVKTYEFVSVNVDGGSTPTSEEKTVTPTKEVQVVLPSSNIDYLSKVTVEAIPENYIEPQGTLEVTGNGSYNCTNYASVNVSVEGGSTAITKGVTFENYVQGSSLIDGGTITPRKAVVVGYDGEKVIDYLCAGFGENLASRSYFISNINEIVINCLPSAIGSYAFSYCEKITSFNVPDSVIEIDKGAFYNCTSLTNITMNNVKKLASYCFYNCTSLVDITIPQTIEEIQASAILIGKTDNKATIRIKATTPPVIYTSTFDSKRINKIIVPQGTKALYDVATNWILLKDLIEEEA